MDSIEDVVLVIVTGCEGIRESYVFVGNTSTIAKLAEEKFFELCDKYLGPIDTSSYYRTEDKEQYLDDGYIDYSASGDCICINWPELCTKRSEPLTAIES